MKKKLRFIGKDIFDNASDAGTVISSVTDSHDGPDPTDSPKFSDEPLRFDSSTLSWTSPNATGFMCNMLTNETHEEGPDIRQTPEEWEA